MQDLTKLQNGSDIRGIAVEGVEGENVNLTPEIVYHLAQGFVQLLHKNVDKEKLVVSVGHDSRISASALKEAICKGLKDAGCIVYDCGLASTPSMFMTTVFDDFKCDGAIMITASHLPYNRNGMKFFTVEGGLDKKDISELISYAKNDIELKEGIIEQKDIILSYANFLVNLIREKVNHPTNYDKPLENMKILVDAGNGAGGFFVDKVLKPLGADTTGSQFLEPDGMFPNHIPNPENKEAMESVCKAVKENNADLGIIFDTDVDRSSAVDKTGKEISRNAIIALAASLLNDYPGTTIVTDSVTSDELHDFIENILGMKHFRFKRGYKNVINESKRLNEEGIDSQLAIETSGHAAFKENYFLDDGAYLATKIIIKAAQLFMKNESIDELIKDLKHALEEKELRFKINIEDFGSYGDKVLKEFKTYCENQKGFIVSPVNHEGLRVNFDEEHGKGWCLLRKSLHDPILPFNIESNVKDGCIVIAKQVYEFLKQYDALDLTSIEEFIK